MDKRALFYGAKLIASQNMEGENYGELVPIYVVVIANFIWDPDSPNMIQKFVLKNNESNKDLTPEKPILAIYFVEFNKLKLHNEIPKSQLEQWLLFFKSPDEDTMTKLKMSSENLSKAVSELEYVRLSKADRVLYDAKIARVRDDNTRVSSARKEAHQEGKTEGLQSAHMKALERFQILALDRFPNITTYMQSVLFMMNDEQLDKQIRMIFKYPDQKAFEIELQKIADEHT